MGSKRPNHARGIDIAERPDRQIERLSGLVGDEADRMEAEIARQAFDFGQRGTNGSCRFGYDDPGGIGELEPLTSDESWRIASIRWRTFENYLRDR